MLKNFKDKAPYGIEPLFLMVSLISFSTAQSQYDRYIQVFGELHRFATLSVCLLIIMGIITLLPMVIWLSDTYRYQSKDISNLFIVENTGSCLDVSSIRGKYNKNTITLHWGDDPNYPFISCTTGARGLDNKSTLDLNLFDIRLLSKSGNEIPIILSNESRQDRYVIEISIPSPEQASEADKLEVTINKEAKLPFKAFFTTNNH
ncbi:hypothetical protein DZF79_05265 [Vibrio parahaemolyticus]|nr:hypothetical protein [Vibrio parahaemolyticus]